MRLPSITARESQFSSNTFDRQELQDHKQVYAIFFHRRESLFLPIRAKPAMPEQVERFQNNGQVGAVINRPYQ
jgi:hypothetical protein